MAAKKTTTLVRPHDWLITMPKLHIPNTVAWGLLKWARWVDTVATHWDNPSWRVMAFLLIGVSVKQSYHESARLAAMLANCSPAVSR